MTIKKLVFCALLSFVVLFPMITLAADPAPINLNFAPPCIPSKGVLGLDTCGSPLTNASTIQDYLIRFYQFAVGISGIVAVGMIVWGSIQISLFSESITAKSEGREKITSAVIGIVLLLGSYLILRTVNPRIVSLGEMLGPSTVPANTTAPAALPKPTEACADPATITGEAWIGNTNPDANNTCKYRKLFIVKDGLQVPANSSYYNIPIRKNIAPQSVIWTYPYTIVGQGASSAKCIIYAYQEPGDKGASYVGLQKTIAPCVLVGTSTQLAGYSGGPGNTSSTATSSPSGMTVPDSIKTAAAAAMGGNISYDQINDCSPNASNALGVIGYLSAGNAPYVCHSGCKTDGSQCAITGVYPNASILGAIASLKGFKNSKGYDVSFTVQSLTGGDHSATSKHYTGNAFDITVFGGDIATYNEVITKLNSSGVTAYCEYRDASGATKFLPSCPAGASGSSNLHIHAQN